MRKLILLLVLLAQPSLAETRAFLTWENDGVVCFTDNPELVPSKFLDSAKIVEIDGLKDYGRATFVSDDGSHARRVESRLADLRARR